MGEYDRIQKKQEARAIANSKLNKKLSKVQTNNKALLTLQSKTNNLLQLMTATITDGTNSVTAVSSIDKQERALVNMNFCPSLKQKLDELSIPEVINDNGSIRGRYQCAEPKALGKYIFSNRTKINTQKLKELTYSQIKNEEKENEDAEPCPVCATWIVGRKINPIIIPSGLKSEEEQDEAHRLMEESKPIKLNYTFSGAPSKVGAIISNIKKAAEGEGYQCETTGRTKNITIYVTLPRDKKSAWDSIVAKIDKK